MQRLRSECGAGDSNRPERPLARPKRRRVSNELDDDAPTYVDEDSQNVVSKETYEAMISKNELEDPEQAHPSGRAEEEEEEVARTAAFSEPTTGSMTLKEPAANIGRSTKKRLVKVIGDDGDFAQASDETRSGYNSPDNFRRTQKSKKSKKIKLSFDDVA